MNRPSNEPSGHATSVLGPRKIDRSPLSAVGSAVLYVPDTALQSACAWKLPSAWNVIV